MIPYPIYKRDEPEYELHRLKFVNGNVPLRYPAEIHIPDTADQVASSLRRAKSLNLPVGVRSGGHLFPCTSLLQNGILIDTCNINRRVAYDQDTQEIDFGPAVRVKECSVELQRLGRFFPTGHAPTVALGGFCLAGGQGWFMRGWGATADTWVTQIEVVTPDGRVVIANNKDNCDLFWAARGSGQWFFGVVTRIWGRTIPAKHVYHRTLMFRVEDAFEDLLVFAFERNQSTPTWGTETAICTFYPSKYNTQKQGDDFGEEALLLVAESVAYADDLNEAQTLLNAWTDVPEHLKRLVVQDVATAPTTWQQLFDLQDALVPFGNGERWLCDSILNDPAGSETKMIAAVKSAMCDLPTRTSVGCVYIGDTYPDPQRQAFSLPQQYYIATFVGTSDPSRDRELKQWLYDVYKHAESVACGMYIADYDHSYRKTKVMTDDAFSKWLRIKTKFDPENMFPCSAVANSRQGG